MDTENVSVVWPLDFFRKIESDPLEGATDDMGTPLDDRIFQDAHERLVVSQDGDEYVLIPVSSHGPVSLYWKPRDQRFLVGSVLKE